MLRHSLHSTVCFIAGEYSRLPERNPELEGTEAVEHSSTESSGGSGGPNPEEWETWLNTHNKLAEEMNDTKHTLIALQELVSKTKFQSFC